MKQKKFSLDTRSKLSRKPLESMSKEFDTDTSVTEGERGRNLSRIRKMVRWPLEGPTSQRRQDPGVTPPITPILLNS